MCINKLRICINVYVHIDILLYCDGHLNNGRRIEKEKNNKEKKGVEEMITPSKKEKLYL